LFGGEAPLDGLERNAKKEDARDGVEDDVDAVCVWLEGDRDILEDVVVGAKAG
jgi:hypothetical protein